MDTELIGGRYRLDGELGSGGMGTVWRGFDELLARPVAVKEIRFPPRTSAQEHAELTARAMTEARAAAALTHPAIVAVHDVTMHDGRPWIIMQLVPGRSLQQMVAEDGPLSPDEAAQVGLRLLDALQTAHAGGVTHRDVKPSNVLMPGGGATAMLTDFSIAKVVGYGTTNTGVPIGSAGYIAPERMLTGVSGPEGDLFGLGATLFFALEGVGPFHRPDAMVAILAAAVDPHPRPKLAGHLTALLDALLTKDPRQRATLGQARAMLLTTSATGLATPPPAPQAPPAPEPSPMAPPPLSTSSPQPLAPPPAGPVAQPVAPPPPPAAPAIQPPLQPATPVGQLDAPPGMPVGQPGVPVGQPGMPAGQPGVPVGQPGVPVGQPGVPVGQPGAPSASPVAQPAGLAQPVVPEAQRASPLTGPASPLAGPALPLAGPAPLPPQPLSPEPLAPEPMAPPPVSALAAPLLGHSGPVTAPEVDPPSAPPRSASLAVASPTRPADDPPTVQVPQWNKGQGPAGFTRGRASVPTPPPARKTASDLPAPEPEPRPQREERRHPRRGLLVTGVGLVAAATVGGAAWALRGRKPGQATPGPGSTSPTPPSNVDVLAGHRDEVWAVAWAADSQRIASASSDFTVRLWTTTSDASTRVLTGHAGEVLSVEWSPDGNLLASGAADNSARIWDTKTGAISKTLPHEQAVRSVAWSPDGRFLATGCNDRKIRVWDVASGQALRMLVGHTTAALAVAWSPDGAALASVGDLGDQAGFLLGSVIAARVWDPATGTQTLTVSTGKRAAGPAGLSKGSTLTGTAVARRRMASPATTSVAWSPDSALLATGNDASTTWLWDAKTGEQLRVLGGHTDIVNAVAFKPDEALLVTASADQTILLWNPGSSTVLRTFSGHTGAVNALAFSPDGKRLVSGSSDKTLRLWEAVA